MYKPKMSHEERRIRREKIAIALVAGGELGQVASQFGVTTATALRCVPSSVQVKCLGAASHEMRRLRREKIAAYAAREGIDAAAQHFKVSRGTVYNAALENGVRPRKTPRFTGDRYLRVLSSLIKGHKQFAIAQEHKITKQAVSQIYKRAVELEILPKRQSKREVKTENERA